MSGVLDHSLQDTLGQVCFLGEVGRHGGTGPARAAVSPMSATWGPLSPDVGPSAIPGPSSPMINITHIHTLHIHTSHTHTTHTHHTHTL